MKTKQILYVLCVMLLVIGLFGTTVYAAGAGDVAGAIEGTWKDASGLYSEYKKKGRCIKKTDATAQPCNKSKFL